MRLLERSAVWCACLIFLYGGLTHVGLLYLFTAYGGLSFADKVALRGVPIVVLVGVLGGLTFTILEEKFFIRMVGRRHGNLGRSFLAGGGLGIAATIGVIEVCFAAALAPAAYAGLPDLLKNLTQLIAFLEIYLLEFVVLQISYAPAIAGLVPLAFCYGGAAGIFLTLRAKVAGGGIVAG